MADGIYTRYVAIGDSQTEGLWDGDDSVGLVGFADRLAAILDSHHPGLQYANLAVRGRRIQDVLDNQLPQALSMRPDLISVCIGMNDVTRPGRHFDRGLADLNIVYERLARSGATVLTTTFPDVARMLPVGRLIASRIGRINEAIAAAAERHGFRLVDLYPAASMTQHEPGAKIGCTGPPRGTSCSPPRLRKR
jgi:lysophospholipase L1-like esterase